MFLAQEPTDLEVMFVHQVLPVLQEKGIACMEASEASGPRFAKSRGLVAEGSEGSAWNVGPAQALLKAVRWDGLEMPLKQNDRSRDGGRRNSSMVGWRCTLPCLSRIAESSRVPTSNLESSGVPSGRAVDFLRLGRCGDIREHLCLPAFSHCAAETGDREEAISWTIGRVFSSSKAWSKRLSGSASIRRAT